MGRPMGAYVPMLLSRTTGLNRQVRGVLISATQPVFGLLGGINQCKVNEVPSN